MATLVVLTVAMIFVDPPAHAARKYKKPTTTTTTTTTQAPIAAHVTTGVWQANPYDLATWPARLDDYSARTGKAPSVVMWYQGWVDNGGFPVDQANAVRARNATPLITWEPYDWQAGVDQPAYSLDALRGGSYDPYITSWATGAKNWGGPVYLRFGHEMNGNWYPWSEGVNGSTPLVGLYPGDAYVDVIGIDGYNWGTSQSWTKWQSFGTIFTPTIDDVRTIAQKPIWISETGSSELGGDKAAWLNDMFTHIAAEPRISGLIWFNENKETDWRVESSAASEAAFRSGMSSAHFSSAQ